ncbi:hypothetical protein ONZ51_g6691 [Trametes cubensis]|uniref:Uncharacterized protein n=1 Tax=Trametes cubensis TaxID=1111947 RepID=A0AAD7XCF6_9APHY|nr:hypothetical protein ONZ51_g6691 [Trametes cubensis]
MATMTTAHAVTWSPPTPDRARTDERLEPFVWSMHQSRASTSPLTLFQPYYRTLRMPRTALADTLFHGHGKQDHQHPRIRDGRRAIERRTLFDGRPALEVREALHLPSAALPRSSLPPDTDPSRPGLSARAHLFSRTLSPALRATANWYPRAIAVELSLSHAVPQRPSEIPVRADNGLRLFAFQDEGA